MAKDPCKLEKYVYEQALEEWQEQYDNLRDLLNDYQLNSQIAGAVCVLGAIEVPVAWLTGSRALVACGAASTRVLDNIIDFMNLYEALDDDGKYSKKIESAKDKYDECIEEHKSYYNKP